MEAAVKYALVDVLYEVCNIHQHSTQDELLLTIPCPLDQQHSIIPVLNTLVATWSHDKHYTPLPRMEHTKTSQPTQQRRPSTTLVSHLAAPLSLPLGRVAQKLAFSNRARLVPTPIPSPLIFHRGKSTEHGYHQHSFHLQTRS